MRGQKTMQAQETKWIQEIMQIQKMMQGQEMMRAGCCSKGVAAGTVEASPWPAWSIASRSTPGDQRKGCSELRPRSHAWTKPQPVFPWSLAPAMIPSSLPLSAKLCKMNTGNSSENTQLFTQSWSVDGVITITQVWRGAQAGRAGGCSQVEREGWECMDWRLVASGCLPSLLHWDHGD